MKTHIKAGITLVSIVIVVISSTLRPDIFGPVIIGTAGIGVIFILYMLLLDLFGEDE